MFQAKRTFVLTAILLARAILPPNTFSQAPRANTDISAPLVYDGTMLVLVSGNGLAAVIFRQTAGGGAAYDFRFEGSDGKMLEGFNKPLFETRNPMGDLVGELYIKAGPISLGWSKGGDSQGWIYYTPEKVAVHLASAKDFADRVEHRGAAGTTIPKLDLRRFRNQPAP